MGERGAKTSAIATFHSVASKTLLPFRALVKGSNTKKGPGGKGKCRPNGKNASKMGSCRGKKKYW
jgi:hypothetical protein